MKKQKPIQQIAKELAEKLGVEIRISSDKDFEYSAHVFKTYRAIIHFFKFKGVDTENIRISRDTDIKDAQYLADLIKEIEPKARIYQEILKEF